MLHTMPLFSQDTLSSKGSEKFCNRKSQVYLSEDAFSTIINSNIIFAYYTFRIVPCIANIRKIEMFLLYVRVQYECKETDMNLFPVITT